MDQRERILQNVESLLVLACLAQRLGQQGQKVRTHNFSACRLMGSKPLAHLFNPLFLPPLLDQRPPPPNSCVREGYSHHKVAAHLKPWIRETFSKTQKFFADFVGGS